jgi:hypothetical protein
MKYSINLDTRGKLILKYLLLLLLIFTIMYSLFVQKSITENWQLLYSELDYCNKNTSQNECNNDKYKNNCIWLGGNVKTSGNITVDMSTLLIDKNIAADAYKPNSATNSSSMCKNYKELKCKAFDNDYGGCSKNHNCYWVSSDNDCRSYDNNKCKDLNGTKCNNNPACRWIPRFNTCYDNDVCDKMNDKTTCNNNNPCRWNDTTNKCVIQNTL